MLSLLLAVFLSLSLSAFSYLHQTSMTLIRPPAQNDVERGDFDAAALFHSSRSSAYMSPLSAAHDEDDVVSLTDSETWFAY